MPAIIVFSHLRWDFVFQRPQHLLTRLAKYYPIVFVEEPMFREGASHFEISSPAPNVQVYRPFTSVQSAPGFHDEQLPQLGKLVKQLVKDYPDHIAWFYTPMALPLLQEIEPRVVVYDCMDELAAFKNAPKQLLQRESALLKTADIVFTGGPSLYRAKKDRHPNAHCFPSSVDVAHFAQALDRTTSHEAHRNIPGPRLGFYGVIDERFDAPLIEKVADAHPQWQLVMVGPIVKIDPAALPQRDNIHYLGQRSYDDLPKFLAGWDVCLLPFALNESTKFISPTKTIEYMAAELPVVSTPIADVVELYGEGVSIAHDADSFIAACEAALMMNAEERAELISRMHRICETTSWDSTALKMHELLDVEHAKRATGVKHVIPTASATTASESGAAVNALRKHAPVPHVKHLVIGAGPTGLSAAYHLSKDTLVLDKNASVGGSCRSIEENGFTFDLAGHMMQTTDPYVLRLYKTLLGDNIHWQDRQAWIFSKQTYTRYPFHESLFGLPNPVIKECLLGAIEARYGREGAAKDVGTQNTSSAATAVNYEEFIYQTWGNGIAEHFAIPYNRKLWTVPLAEIETSWLGDQIAMPDIEAIIDGALEPSPTPSGPHNRVGYPLRGGFQALMSAFVPHIKGEVELNADVVSISPQERLVALSDGRRFTYDTLISTMPLPELVAVVGDAAPTHVKEAAAGLRHVSVRCVHLGIARENVTDKHWIYYPEDTVFHRIFAQGNASEHCNPPGGFGLTCEVSYSAEKPLPFEGQALIDRCFSDCVRAGLLNEDDKLLASSQVDIPYAYVIYDRQRQRHVEVLKTWFARYGITLSGRFGEWEYYNSDYAFIAGKHAAEEVARRQAGKLASAE
ncbi:MAG: UDP-galactopyranose mutase [Paucimonas sp.]|nr:UDP-galactopyranose mutase [Paucimonas sp.]